MDKCKTELYKYSLDDMEEIEIEYEDGRSSKFCYDEMLEEGCSESREDSLLDWLSDIDWNNVEEVEVEFYDGKKIEIDLEDNEFDADDDDEEEEDKKKCDHCGQDIEENDDDIDNDDEDEDDDDDDDDCDCEDCRA